MTINKTSMAAVGFAIAIRQMALKAGQNTGCLVEIQADADTVYTPLDCCGDGSAFLQIAEEAERFIKLIYREAGRTLDNIHLLMLADAVLESKHKGALTNTILALHSALKDEGELPEIRKQVAESEKQITETEQRIRQMEARLRRLKGGD